MNKLISISDAINMVTDGMTIMVGGFLAHGTPLLIMDALANTTVKNLTLICNDTAYPDKGHGQLIANKQVKKLITSYIGANPASAELMNAGEMEVEFCPQGTLAERIRAGGSGLGGVLTPTGLGTNVQNGKQIINVDGCDYILEKPLKADIAFVGASIADEAGNLYFKGTTRNFNTLMAMSATKVIAETQQLVEKGAIEPENVHTPAILVNYIVKNK